MQDSVVFSPVLRVRKFELRHHADYFDGSLKCRQKANFAARRTAEQVFAHVVADEEKRGVLHSCDGPKAPGLAWFGGRSGQKMLSCLSKLPIGCALQLQVTFFGDKKTHLWSPGERAVAKAVALWLRRGLGRPPRYSASASFTQTGVSMADSEAAGDVGVPGTYVVPTQPTHRSFSVQQTGSSIMIVSEFLRRYMYSSAPWSLAAVGWNDIDAAVLAMSTQPESRTVTIAALRLVNSLQRWGACRIRIPYSNIGNQGALNLLLGRWHLPVGGGMQHGVSAPVAPGDIAVAHSLGTHFPGHPSERQSARVENEVLTRMPGSDVGVQSVPGQKRSIAWRSHWGGAVLGTPLVRLRSELNDRAEKDSRLGVGGSNTRREAVPAEPGLLEDGEQALSMQRPVRNASATAARRAMEEVDDLMRRLSATVLAAVGCVADGGLPGGAGGAGPRQGESREPGAAGGDTGAGAAGSGGAGGAAGQGTARSQPSEEQNRHHATARLISGLILADRPPWGLSSRARKGSSGGTSPRGQGDRTGSQPGMKGGVPLKDNAKAAIGSRGTAETVADPTVDTSRTTVAQRSDRDSASTLTRSPSPAEDMPTPHLPLPQEAQDPPMLSSSPQARPLQELSSRWSSTVIQANEYESGEERPGGSAGQCGPGAGSRAVHSGGKKARPDLCPPHDDIGLLTVIPRSDVGTLHIANETYYSAVRARNARAMKAKGGKASKSGGDHKGAASGGAPGIRSPSRPLSEQVQEAVDKPGHIECAEWLAVDTPVSATGSDGWEEQQAMVGGSTAEDTEGAGRHGSPGQEPYVEVVVLAGRTLEALTYGAIPACRHRVVASTDGRSRRSLVCKVRLPPEVLLSEGKQPSGTSAAVQPDSGGYPSLHLRRCIAPPVMFAAAMQWCNAGGMAPLPGRQAGGSPVVRHARLVGHLILRDLLAPGALSVNFDTSAKRRQYAACALQPELNSRVWAAVLSSIEQAESCATGDLLPAAEGSSGEHLGKRVDAGWASAQAVLPSNQLRRLIRKARPPPGFTERPTGVWIAVPPVLRAVMSRQALGSRNGIGSVPDSHLKLGLTLRHLRPLAIAVLKVKVRRRSDGSLRTPQFGPASSALLSDFAECVPIVDTSPVEANPPRKQASVIRDAIAVKERMRAGIGYPTDGIARARHPLDGRAPSHQLLQPGPQLDQLGCHVCLVAPVVDEHGKTPSTTQDGSARDGQQKPQTGDRDGSSAQRSRPPAVAWLRTAAEAEAAAVGAVHALVRWIKSVDPQPTTTLVFGVLAYARYGAVPAGGAGSLRLPDGGNAVAFSTATLPMPVSGGGGSPVGSAGTEEITVVLL